MILASKWKIGTFRYIYWHINCLRISVQSLVYLNVKQYHWRKSIQLMVKGRQKLGTSHSTLWSCQWQYINLYCIFKTVITETKGLNVLNWSDHFTLSFPEIGFDKIERLLSFLYFTVRTLIFIVYSFFFETIVDISYKSHKPHFSMLLSGFFYNKNRKKQLN